MTAPLQSSTDHLNLWRESLNDWPLCQRQSTELGFVPRADCSVDDVEQLLLVLPLLKPAQQIGDVSHPPMRLHCSAPMNSLFGAAEFPVSGFREFIGEMAEIQGKRRHWMASRVPKIDNFPVNSLLTGKMSVETR